MDDEFFYIVGRPSCPYCEQAKDLLKDKELKHEFRNLENNRELMLEYVKKFEWDTVPMVFHFDEDGKYKFLGGFSGLVEFLESREL